MTGRMLADFLAISRQQLALILKLADLPRCGLAFFKIETLQGE